MVESGLAQSGIVDVGVHRRSRGRNRSVQGVALTEMHNSQ
jgi:hypothetical protein